MFLKLLAFVLSFSLSLLSSAQTMTGAQQSPSSEISHSPCDTLIQGGKRFDSDLGRFIPNKAVAIRDQRIESLDQIVEAKEVIKLEESDFLLPGLIDCHAHYNVRLFRKRREEFEVIPVQYLANGVCVTFSCGEFDPEGMRALRMRLDSGEQVGPRLINSGPYFGRARPGWRGERNAEEIRQEVDFWAKQGVGGFKAKQIGLNELKVLIEQAHKHGLTVTGHLDSGFRGSVNPRDAIEMGIDRIEHFLGGDSMPGDRPAYDSLESLAFNEQYAATIKQFVDHGVWFDATITAYGYFGKRGTEFDQWIDERSLFTPFIQKLVSERGPAKPVEQFEKIYQVKLLTTLPYYQAGGLLTLGTDHFSDGNYLPGFGAHRELEAFVRCGISPEDALRIGTINGAKALRIEKDHGSISVGKFADFFVVEKNPLEDIRNTRSIKSVIRAGKQFDPAELLKSVSGKLGPKDESEAAAW